MPFALPHCHTYRTHVYPSNVPMYSTLFSGRIAQIVFVAQCFKSGRIDQSGAIYPAMNSSAALCSPFNKYPVRRSSVQRELCFTENFVQPDTPPPACLLHSHPPPPPVILQYMTFKKLTRPKIDDMISCQQNFTCLATFLPPKNVMTYDCISYCHQ